MTLTKGGIIREMRGVNYSMKPIVKVEKMQSFENF